MKESLIEYNKNKCFGMPSLKGRRLTVYDIVTKLFYEDSINEAIEDYNISIQEAIEATEYCKMLCCQKDDERIQFCDGCVLRTIEEKSNFNKTDFIQIDNQLTVSKNGSFVFLGSLDELEEDQLGKQGWIIANEVYKKLIK